MGAEVTKSAPARPRVWPYVAIVGFLALFVGYVAYTRALVGDIREDTERLATLYARALRITSPDDAQLFVFEEVIQSFSYPVILTDEAGNPTAIKNLDDIGIANGSGPWTPEERSALRQEAARMDRLTAPYPVADEDGRVVQTIHISEASTITLLRYLPYIQGLGLAAIGLIGFWLIRYNLGVQRGQVWVAMARESAHQLGTPISSLYGWVELLRAERSSEATVADPPGLDAESALTAMEQDLDRLTKVANRFELIGRRPRLEELDLGEVMHDLEAYSRARLPQRSQAIKLVTDFEPVPHVPANRTLLEWGLENLIKNAVDALHEKGGTITLRMQRAPTAGQVWIEVADDGPGISRAIRKRIFDAGVTTKSHGWGVGLSLTRRIVEDYHGGALELLPPDGPAAGATFRVTLPAAPEQEFRPA